MDRQTSCDGIVCAMHPCRAVKINEVRSMWFSVVGSPGPLVILRSFLCPRSQALPTLTQIVIGTEFTSYLESKNSTNAHNPTAFTLLIYNLFNIVYTGTWQYIN